MSIKYFGVFEFCLKFQILNKFFVKVCIDELFEKEIVIDDDVMIIEKFSFWFVEVNDVVVKEKFVNESKEVIFVEDER